MKTEGFLAGNGIVKRIGGRNFSVLRFGINEYIYSCLGP